LWKTSELKLMSDNIQIESSWKALLKNEFNEDYFTNIKQFILNEKAKGKEVYPPGKLMFNAFNFS
jgi:uracil-DNA glycosylase